MLAFPLASPHQYLNRSGLRVKYFTPILFSLWAFTEVVRLYVGYQGNLKEDVREHTWKGGDVYM